MRNRKTAATIAVGLVVLLGGGVATAQASVMPDPDIHYRWWGPTIGWETIVDNLGVGEPGWDVGFWDLDVYNIQLAPPWHKDVIVEAVFAASAPAPHADDMDMWIIDANDDRQDLDAFNVGGNTWTVVWHMPSQMIQETVHWEGNRWGHDLLTEVGDDILYVDVATACTPEPTTLSLLALGSLVILRRRR